VSLSSEHLHDDALSALLDSDAPRAEAPHLATCAACDQRLEELRAVVGLLRGLPDVPPPRDFTLQVDPPNVIRLRSWYVWTRAASGALAAVFVFLVAGALYLDSAPPAAAPRAVPAAAVIASAAPASAPAPAAPAPAVAPAAQAPQPAAALRQRPPAESAGAAADASDQVAAATSVRPLPTPAPTPTLFVARPPVASEVPVAPAADPVAPLRTAAALVGILAVGLLFITIVLRHRLRATFASE
jgi:hypothetical protein